MWKPQHLSLHNPLHFVGCGYLLNISLTGFFFISMSNTPWGRALQRHHQHPATVKMIKIVCVVWKRESTRLLQSPGKWVKLIIDISTVREIIDSFISSSIAEMRSVHEWCNSHRVYVWPLQKNSTNFTAKKRERVNSEICDNACSHITTTMCTHSRPYWEPTCMHKHSE